MPCCVLDADTAGSAGSTAACLVLLLREVLLPCRSTT